MHIQHYTQTSPLPPGLTSSCSRALLVDTRLTMPSPMTVLLHYCYSWYQSDGRESQCLPTSGLPRNHHTCPDPKCNLWLQVDLRNRNDKVGNGLGLQGLPTHLVQPHDVSPTLHEPAFNAPKGLCKSGGGTRSLEIDQNEKCESWLILGRSSKGLPKYHRAVKYVAAYTALGYVIVLILFLGAWCRPVSWYWKVPVPNCKHFASQSDGSIRGVAD